MIPLPPALERHGREIFFFEHLWVLGVAELPVDVFWAG